MPQFWLSFREHIALIWEWLRAILWYVLNWVKLGIYKWLRMNCGMCVGCFYGVSGITIFGVWFLLWWSGGERLFIIIHSSEEERFDGEIILRCTASASHRMKIKRSRAVKDVVAPNVETTFHIM